MGVAGQQDVIVKALGHAERGVGIVSEQDDRPVRQVDGKVKGLATLPEVGGAGYHHVMAAKVNARGAVVEDCDASAGQAAEDSERGVGSGKADIMIAEHGEHRDVQLRQRRHMRRQALCAGIIDEVTGQEDRVEVLFG